MDGITKRANKYNIRPFRSANGFSKTFADQKKNGTEIKDKNLKLALYGNFDTLNTRNNKGRVIMVKIKHPIYKEYYKDSYILRKNKHKFDIL